MGDAEKSTAGFKSFPPKAVPVMGDAGTTGGGIFLRAE
jgi:hypothetical protein